MSVFSFKVIHTLIDSLRYIFHGFAEFKCRFHQQCAKYFISDIGESGVAEFRPFQLFSRVSQSIFLITAKYQYKWAIYLYNN